MSVIRGERLESFGEDKATDIGATTLGLLAVNTVSEHWQTARFVIRKMRLDNHQKSNHSSVAVYVNGVYQSTPIRIEIAFFNRLKKGRASHRKNLKSSFDTLIEMASSFITNFEDPLLLDLIFLDLPVSVAR